MFDTQRQFSLWLAAHLGDEQRWILDKLSAKTRKQLYEIYETGSALNGNYELENVVRKLGGTLYQLIQMANGLNWAGSDKKQFVMSNALALSRLIDNGKDGTEDHINKNIEGFEFIADDPDGFQEKFIRPQVDRAVEEVYQMWKQFTQQQQELTDALDAATTAMEEEA